ncbi:MAG: hypothetical protein H7Y31_09205 [Chitinophagaceae bacterium]|nr:hypothetical protein [Chitinophagaceae bacterium]
MERFEWRRVITADKDRHVIGDANPDFTGGWLNEVRYGNFYFSVFVNFVVGNDLYNANKLEWTDGAFPNLNMLGGIFCSRPDKSK